jgi:hypothetical protein
VLLVATSRRESARASGVSSSAVAVPGVSYMVACTARQHELASHDSRPKKREKLKLADIYIPGPMVVWTMEILRAYSMPNQVARVAISYVGERGAYMISASTTVAALL